MGNLKEGSIPSQMTLFCVFVFLEWTYMLLLSLKFALLVGYKLLIISFFMINLLVAKS
jgi:hypothetical protein